MTSVVREPALVLIVRDPRIDYKTRRAIFDRGLDGSEQTFAWRTRMSKSDRLEVVWPVPTQIPDRDAWNVVYETLKVDGPSPSLYDAVMHVRRDEAHPAPCRYADAAAVAGVRAASSGSRRAVIVLLTVSDVDFSLRSADSVRHYLQRIHVPLYVWSLGDVRPPLLPPDAVWGDTVDVSSPKKFHVAVSRLLDDLERQSVVWLEGTHLPQDIVLAEAKDGLTIAR